MTLATLPEYDSNDVEQREGKAVVIGAGFAGFCAARVLADCFPRVLILERDCLLFDLSLRLEQCVERFANRYDKFPRSRSIINRRVKAAANKVDLPGRVYPHCLRATAASYHAYKGVALVPLQALVGWSDPATAQMYIRISGTATTDASRRVHHR